MATTTNKRSPVRTCVACREAGGKVGLLRVVRLPSGSGVALDPSGKSPGRGAYVHANAECLALALKRGALSRSLKMPIPDEVAAALQAAL